MPPRLHFLPWDRPLLPQAVTWLAGNWSGAGPLDLSSLMVVVPTRQSGRRLREAIAGHAATKGQAAFAPRVLTPDRLLRPVAGGAATRLQSTLAWVEVLREVDIENCREVFPTNPPARDWAWAHRLAEAMIRLQATLAEHGLRLADVAARVKDGWAEPVRWSQLAELERAHEGKLSARGLRDAEAAMIAATAHSLPPPGIGRIILLATPDPLPLAVSVLQAHARVLPVDVVVYAPPDEAPGFDEWGRPRPEVWAHRDLALPDFGQHVHLCADPGAQAERMTAALAAVRDPARLFGVGVADAEVLPLLENSLTHAGLVAFNQEGRPNRQGQLYHLIAALAGLVRETSFDTVATLARAPDFLAYLRTRFGSGFSMARWLAGLDDLRARHLPADLEGSRAQAGRWSGPAEVAQGLDVVEEFRAALTAGEFAAGAAGVLGEMFGARQFDRGRESDAKLEAAATAWTEALRECATAGTLFPAVERTEWWDLALRNFGDSPAAVDKPAGSVELLGWLELLWEDAPHLLVAGLNDGRVPEAVVGDAFLPESLREILGLKTNADRLGRDMYLLQALAAARVQGGRIDLLYGKTSSAGEPLRPSRLLLRCPDELLPARVSFLFREPEPDGANPPWTRAWRLKPRRLPPPERVAVTALRAWLECPFRFYLRHVLRLEAVDPAKNELDALDFGTLCHAALEVLGRDPGLRDSTDAAALRDGLLAELDRKVRVRYGEYLALPLVIQVQSARQRLSRVAAVQAEERAAGWRIEQVERKFTLGIGGLLVSGKIDRIERNEATGAVRVLDYKTSDAAANPLEAHFRSPRGDEEAHPWLACTIGGRIRAWADLQLPLYRHALVAEYPGAAVTCGYFNLPKATAGTGLALWEDSSAELQAAALRCAEGICGAVRAGEFWPPSEKVREDTDDFAALFHHGVAASVAWEADA